MKLLALASLLAAVVACSEEPKPFVPYVPQPGTPESVAYDNGLTRYLGHTPVVSSSDGNAGTRVHAFVSPRCLRTSDARASSS